MVVVEPIKLNTALVVLGFCCLVWVYKKPKAVPGKANRLAQEEFLENIEQKLAENPDKVAVYYADGVHPQHNTHCSYGWIKRGENKEIETNTGRN